jgi:hypothetical protein
MIQRPLAPYERLFHWAITQRDAFVPIQVIRFQYTSDSKNLVNTLKQSLLILQQRYQILTLTINENDEYKSIDLLEAQELFLKYHFHVIDKAALEQENSNVLWKDIMNREVHKKGSELFSHLLWNVTLLYNSNEMNEIIMSMHHAVADGQSFTILLNEIFEIMESIIENKTDLVNVFHTIPAPIESKLPEYRVTDNSSSSDEKILDFPCAYSEDRKQNLTFITLDKDISQRLLNTCREHGLTVNSIICAAIVLSGYKNAYLETYKTLTNKKSYCDIYISISQRNQCTPVIPQDEVGLYYNGFCAKFHPVTDCQTFDREALFKLSQKIQSQVQQTVQQDPHTQNVSSTDNWFQNVSGFMSTREDQSGRLNHFNVSNRGKLDHLLSSKKHVQLHEMFVITSQWKLGNFLSVHALSLNGSLMLSLATVTPLISTDTHDQIVQDFELLLK